MENSIVSELSPKIISFLFTMIFSIIEGFILIFLILNFKTKLVKGDVKELFIEGMTTTIALYISSSFKIVFSSYIDIEYHPFTDALGSILGNLFVIIFFKYFILKLKKT